MSLTYIGSQGIASNEEMDVEGATMEGDGSIEDLMGEIEGEGR